MRIRVELEMLAVLLLLIPIVADGLDMNKCQMKKEVEGIIHENMTDRNNLITKIVCLAETRSNFNTSLVTSFSLQSFPGIRKTRNAPKKRPTRTTKFPPNPVTKPPSNTATKPSLKPIKPPPNPAAKPPLNPITPPPKLAPKPPVKLTNTQDITLNSKSLIVSSEQPNNNQTEPLMPPNYNFSNTDNEMVPPTPPPSPKSNTTSSDEQDVSKPGFYGVFQLAGRIACTSPSMPSYNICNLSCDKLTDDVITDDINCILTINNAKTANPDGGDEANMLIETERSMFMNACPNMDYALYFAECNNP